MKSICAFVLTLLLNSVAPAQEQPAPPVAPVAPESTGSAFVAESAGLNADPLAAEREALEQVAREYDKQIQALQELALQAKGMEFAELQRRIEELKSRHTANALQVRLRVARETGNERRLQQMEQLAEELSRPQPTPQPTREVRPDTDESRREEDR